MPNRITPRSNAKYKDTFENVFLPLPPTTGMESLELEVYARFMKHVRLSPNNRMQVKIFSAIEFTADFLNLSDALVSKMLADMGLRAPRAAFPESYLNHVDESLMRTGWDVGAPCASTIDMKRFWDDIGEDKFAGFKKTYPRVEVQVRV
jgi:hypothetical protein